MPRDDPPTLELSAIIQRIAERSYNACRDRFVSTGKHLRYCVLAPDFSTICAFRVDAPSATELQVLPPFSSMNSTPAASSFRCKSSSL
jgi:hypothetical protein